MFDFFFELYGGVEGGVKRVAEEDLKGAKSGVLTNVEGMIYHLGCKYSFGIFFCRTLILKLFDVCGFFSKVVILQVSN